MGITRFMEFNGAKFPMWNSWDQVANKLKANDEFDYDVLTEYFAGLTTSNSSFKEFNANVQKLLHIFKTKFLDKGYRQEPSSAIRHEASSFIVHYYKLETTFYRLMGSGQPGPEERPGTSQEPPPTGSQTCADFVYNKLSAIYTNSKKTKKQIKKPKVSEAQKRRHANNRAQKQARLAHQRQSQSGENNRDLDMPQNTPQQKP